MAPELGRQRGSVEEKPREDGKTGTKTKTHNLIAATHLPDSDVAPKNFFIPP
jgi:hypothetical protein